jgi:hypothetical protein
MVKEAEKYRWNSIGYHLQTNNSRDKFLSTDSIRKPFRYLFPETAFGASLNRSKSGPK